MASGTPYERFFMKVRKTDLCWIWMGAKDQAGYGLFDPGDRLQPAHRVAYEFLVGPIPEGLVIDHLCRNVACVNPDHLEPVTTAENRRRGNLPVKILVARRKGVCLKGHPRDESRHCRICERDRSRRRRADPAYREVEREYDRQRKARQRHPSGT